MATSPIALSTNTPAGAPLASRMILPPAGSGVLAVIPAVWIARLLAHCA